MFNDKHNLFGALLITVILFFSNINVSAQDDFASLRKNVNYRAKLLTHYLNKTKDTLVLSCPQRMYRLYSVGSSKVRINEKIDDFTYKLPLKNYKIGKYLLVTQLNGLKIVFELNILKRSDFKEDSVTSLVASGLKETEYTIDVKSINVKLQDPIVRYKPYNLTDINREGMQTRDECRRIMALQRAKLRAELTKKRRYAMQ